MMWQELLTLAGLGLTVMGAEITAHAVVLKEDDAIKIGVARYSAPTREENLKLPAVQNLLKSSRAAKNGLIWIAVGTLLQIVPVATRIAVAFAS